MEVALILKYRYTWSDHQKKTTMKNLEKKKQGSFRSRRSDYPITSLRRREVVSQVICNLVWREPCLLRLR